VNAVIEEIPEVPPGEVTVTYVLPAISAGEYATIDVGEFTVKLAAGDEPNMTDVVPVKPVPVTVTKVPPEVPPVLGEILVIVGPVPLKVN
jgi:hypothetical protein